MFNGLQFPSIGSRSVASSSTHFSLLHTSAARNAESRKHAVRAIKKNNNRNREARLKEENATQPSVVLGIRPGDDAKWANCDLAELLVNEEELISSTVLKETKQPIGTVFIPRQIGFGVGTVEQDLLFRKLPLLSAQIPSPQFPSTSVPGTVPPGTGVPSTGATFDHSVSFDQQKETQRYEEYRVTEMTKANTFAKLLDLRNANAGGIAYENRRRIIIAFSEPDKPFNTGRSEVQGALTDNDLSSH